METGIVIKSTGSWYQVQSEDGRLWKCRIVGKLRLDGIKLTNPVGVGDQVQIEVENEAEDSALIKGVLPRRNYVVRQSPRRKHDLHLLAANVDQAVVIVTVIEPHLKQGFIDRFILMTEPQDIPAFIVFNKADLYGPPEMAVFDYLRDIYESIGYTTLLSSAQTGAGTAALKEILKDKVTLIGGQSGVGKSTLVNSIQPQLDIRTGDLSDYSGKGTHTTTFAEMHPLDFGGALIDTPGIKTLGFNNLQLLDIAHNFREFFQISDQCRFGGSCLHRQEPGCAVRAALGAGSVSELRYGNYLAILTEAEDQNYWERHKDL
ncbi:MAG: ribosome small subunit-dependent GTPase A [Saprospiraceae bacterium]|nr:ribosome small subunit-dependent GTPase A [Saprospiraceae bacterium]